MEKKTIETVGVVLVIILSILATGLIYYYHTDFPGSARYNFEIELGKERAKMGLKDMIYCDEQERLAINMYNNNFTKDEEIMSALYVLRDIRPFIVAQIPTLRDKLCILTKNITMHNYVEARDQYLLCKQMNDPYSENYTVYFNILNEKYKHMWRWLYGRTTPLIDPDEIGKRFMFAIESDYDNDHNDGFEVAWYSDELEYIGSRLDFISGLING